MLGCAAPVRLCLLVLTFVILKLQHTQQFVQYSFCCMAVLLGPHKGHTPMWPISVAGVVRWTEINGHYLCGTVVCSFILRGGLHSHKLSPLYSKNIPEGLFGIVINNYISSMPFKLHRLMSSLHCLPLCLPCTTKMREFMCHVSVTT